MTLYFTESATRMSTTRTDEELDLARADDPGAGGADADGRLRGDAVGQGVRVVRLRPDVPGADGVTDVVDIPRVIVNRRSDVPAKAAFVAALSERDFDARVTGSPADITATKDGQTFYFEIKFTNQSSRYFGAATLTEWEAALKDPTRFFFVTAQRNEDGWTFHEYTPDEFMAFSTVPPFKIFFQIPVGIDHAARPAIRPTKAVPLTEARLTEMAQMFERWRRGDA